MTWIASAIASASTPRAAAFSRSGTTRSSGWPSFRLLVRSTRPPRVASSAIISSARRSSSASARLPRISITKPASEPPIISPGFMMRMLRPGSAAACARPSSMSSNTERSRSARGLQGSEEHAAVGARVGTRPAGRPRSREERGHLGLLEEPRLVVLHDTRASPRGVCRAALRTARKRGPRPRAGRTPPRDPLRRARRAAIDASATPTVIARCSSVVSSTAGSRLRAPRETARGSGTGCRGCARWAAACARRASA